MIDPLSAFTCEMIVFGAHESETGSETQLG